MSHGDDCYDSEDLVLWVKLIKAAMLEEGVPKIRVERAMRRLERQARLGTQFEVDKTKWADRVN